MARCNSCGHDNPPGVSWCVSCSTWLEDASAGTVLDSPPLEPAPPPAAPPSVAALSPSPAADPPPGAMSAPPPPSQTAPAPSPAADPSGVLAREILATLRISGKIQAVKVYREKTGVGLKEAKDAVEALEQSGTLPEAIPLAEIVPRRADAAALEATLLALLKNNRKIDAVKAYCQATGSDLREAVQAVDAIASRHGIEPKKVGCAGVAILVVAAAIGLLA